MISQFQNNLSKPRNSRVFTKLLLCTIFFASFAYSQLSDEIIFKNGGIAKGVVDRTNLTTSTTSIRFMPKGFSAYQYYNIDQINFVRSWNGKLLFPVGVVGNSETMVYHLPNVKHLPTSNKQKSFASELFAKESGFKACPGCFDPSPMIADYELEKQLGRATILEIQREYEIMYEHPRLPELQQMMQDILDTWPEKLKGYEYRIQVIRDESPNAFAIGGGNLYFSTGLLNMAEYSEEIEAILSHEIAHVERRHSLKQFYQYQETQASLAVINSFIIIAAIAIDSEAASIAGSILTTITSFAAEFALHGYSRNLEQEADILAQIRFEQLGKPLSPMLSIMDKLATHTKTRSGYIRGTFAYSSHPDIRGRINQLEQSSFHTFEEPLTLQLYSIDKSFSLNPGFVELSIKYAYETSSSTTPNDTEMVLVGTVHNNHAELGFRLNEIKLNILGGVGQTVLSGVSGLTVSYSGSSDFVGRISYSNGLEAQNRSSVTNKNILPVSVDISAIVFTPGEDPTNMFGLQNIQCTMTIK